MSSGERPIGAAKGKQSDTEALCQPPPPHGGKHHFMTVPPPMGGSGLTTRGRLQGGGVSVEPTGSHGVSCCGGTW